MPIVHLLLVVVIVLAIAGLCWYLLDSVATDARVKTVLNVLLVLGLIIWLVVWLLPKLLAIAG
jgi:hypothetical protein